MSSTIKIREARIEDADPIWEILQPIIQKGDTLYFDPTSSKEVMMSYWLHEDKHTYVAMIEDKIVGSVWIRENAPTLGAHTANAAYITDANHRGKGIGRQMAQFSLAEAKRLGFEAMQFNFVVKSNQGAVHLWQEMGFQIMAEIPDAFQHQTLGKTNIYIMWRKL